MPTVHLFQIQHNLQISFNTWHGERQEEALSAVFVADSALSLLAGLRVDFDLGRHGSNHALLAHHLK